MLHYPFPEIKHIDDIKDVFKKPEFKLIKKDGYQVVNYVFSDQNTFETPLEAECRGLIFDLEGNLLSRRYHKFFNVGERKDSVPDLSKPHIILDKLDGSMVSPLVFKIPSQKGINWPDDINIRLITKMGITDTSMQAETWMLGKANYVSFIMMCYNAGVTPIFEWCSPNNRIVLNYKEEKLVLTAIRRNYTGEYLSYSDMTMYVEGFDIPVVQLIQNDWMYWVHEGDNNLENHLGHFRNSEFIEGVVIRFDDGHMVKIKSEWYVTLHKTKDAISSEAKVLSLVLNEGLDDLLPLLCDEDKKKVLEYQENVFKTIVEMSDKVLSKYQWIKACTTSRKEAAVMILGSDLYKPYAPILFKMFDKHPFSYADEAVLEYMQKHIKDPDSIREFIGCEYNLTQIEG